MSEGEMTQTPRTDAFGMKAMTIDDITPPYPVLARWEAFAKDLERELAAKDKELSDLTEKLTKTCGEVLQITQLHESLIRQADEEYDELFKELAPARAELESLREGAERLKWCYGNSIKPLVDMRVHPHQYPTFSEWIAAIDQVRKP